MSSPGPSHRGIRQWRRSPLLPPANTFIPATTLLAKIDSSGTKYYHQDHLSNRFVTDSSAATPSPDGPLSLRRILVHDASNDKLLFTNLLRGDSESGNDYAGARYNMSRVGRFSSPDPLAGSIADPSRRSSPESLPSYVTSESYWPGRPHGAW